MDVLGLERFGRRRGCGAERNGGDCGQGGGSLGQGQTADARAGSFASHRDQPFFSACAGAPTGKAAEPWDNTGVEMVSGGVSVFSVNPKRGSTTRK